MYVTIPTTRSNPISTQPAPIKKAAPIARALKAGTFLYREGDEAKRIYELETGVLRLSRVLENGRRQVIAFGYPGDIVGFPNGDEYHTECEVLCDATVVAHRREVLEDGEGETILHKRLLQAALREISGMQDHFMMLGRKSAEEKVASFLCVLADRVGSPLGNYTQVTLPMCRSDIADFLSLSTETISRTLTQLRRNNVIALENIHTIIILKPDTLLNLSAGDDC